MAQRRGATLSALRCIAPVADSRVDQVINFYLGLLQDRELRLNPKQPRVHFHSTFFYNKLFADDRAYNYKNVGRCAHMRGAARSLC